MEPKLRARRIEVARDQGRRRLRRLLLVAVAALVVAAAVAATQSPLLDVDAVEVSGADASGAEAVRDAAGIELGEPMTSVDAGAAAASVEALPWVEEASVRRRWPGTVEVSVTERVPVAVVGAGGRGVVVDADGRAMAAAGDADGDLPVVEGQPVSVGDTVADGPRAAIAVVAGLPGPLRREVAEASADGAGTVLVLVDGIEVDWGDERQASAKAEALGVLLEQADRATIATIDLTVPRAATLTRKNGGS